MGWSKCCTHIVGEFFVIFDMVPNNILKEHILSAIEEIERDGVHSGRQSSTYDLKYKGQLYPPKYVIS
ncbi:MAG: hypothetical protein OXR70_04700, partial [Candidatus Marinimicrobia bacterium]|nr:hypothetical protein [Candidatus Neomarinimicrobiota bacterium]